MTNATAVNTVEVEHGDVPRGLIGALIAVCAWSTGTIMAKSIGMGGLAIAAYRFWLFALCIVLYMWARGTSYRCSLL